MFQFPELASETSPACRVSLPIRFPIALETSFDSKRGQDALEPTFVRGRSPRLKGILPSDGVKALVPCASASGTAGFETSME